MQLFFVNLSGRQLPDINIGINGNIIQNSSVVKLLGVYFDPRLSFEKHIDYVTKRMNGRLNLIRRLKICLSPFALNLLYKALVQPIVDYGIAIYGFTFESHFKRVETIQRRAAKTITGSDHFDPGLYCEFSSVAKLEGI